MTLPNDPQIGDPGHTTAHKTIKELLDGKTSLGATTVEASAYGNNIAAALAALAVASPAGGTVLLNAASYTTTATLTLGAGQVLRGAGKYATTILHGFNGDFATLGHGAGLENLTVEGQGATYTGRGLVFNGTDSQQYLTNVRVINFDNYCLDFAGGAGSLFRAHALDAFRTSAGTGTGRYAIRFENVVNTAAYRSFVQYNSHGQCSFDWGGANGVWLVASAVSDMLYRPDSGDIQFLGGRWLNTASATIDGNYNSLIGVDIAPALTIAAGADAVSIGPGGYNNLPVVDNSGNDRNLITHWEADYVPTFESSTGVASLGNGTLTGKFSRSGSAITCTVKLTVGSTTTFGTGVLRIGLPVTRVNGLTYGGTATFLDSSAGTFYNFALQLPTGANYVTFLRDPGGFFVPSVAAPVVAATGDSLDFTFTFQP